MVNKLVKYNYTLVDIELIKNIRLNSDQMNKIEQILIAHISQTTILISHSFNCAIEESSVLFTVYGRQFIERCVVFSHHFLLLMSCSGSK